VSVRENNLNTSPPQGKAWIERMKIRRASEGSHEMFNSHPMRQQKIPTELQSNTRILRCEPPLHISYDNAKRGNSLRTEPQA